MAFPFPICPRAAGWSRRAACPCVVALATVFALLSPPTAAASGAKRPPNIVFILVDDLGWGDVGCYGQDKIRTPNIDRLAREGLRFTNFYAGNAVCAPSRCVLMTGLHAGHAYIRSNKEVQPEGQEPIPDAAVTVAELLRRAGYATGCFGKWGLGPVGSSGDPLNQGFQRFFGYNCQRHAHNFYPTYLWRDRERVQLAGNTAGLTGKNYSHDLIEYGALAFLRQNKDRPFFLYVPFTIPHVALQVPEDSLAEYTGKWDDPPYKGGKGYLPHPHPRAAYAAMVTRMDRSVGRIVDLLGELGLDDNTIVFFSSDNGGTHGGVGGSDSVFFRSTGPFREFKGSLHEGGLRVPMIVRWKGHVPAGQTSDLPAVFYDVLPTLCELAGADTPPEVDGVSLVPTLLGKGEQKRHEFLYWEFSGYGGQQAVRLGDWKGIRKGLNKKKADLRVELYNLAEDVGETKDVAAEHPDVVRRVQRIMAANHVPSRLFPIAALDGAQKAGAGE